MESTANGVGGYFHGELHALRHQYGYPRLYRHAGAEGAGTRGVAGGWAAGGAGDGWPMTAQTKPRAMQELARMLRDAPEVFASARLLEQCRRYSYTSDGRMAAAGGASGGGSRIGAGPGMGDDDESAVAGHDDLVVAMAIALAVRASTPPVELLAPDRAAP